MTNLAKFLFQGKNMSVQRVVCRVYKTSLCQHHLVVGWTMKMLVLWLSCPSTNSYKARVLGCFPVMTEIYFFPTKVLGEIYPRKLLL